MTLLKRKGAEQSVSGQWCDALSAARGFSVSKGAVLSTVSGGEAIWATPAGEPAATVSLGGVFNVACPGTSMWQSLSDLSEYKIYTLFQLLIYKKSVFDNRRCYLFERRATKL